MWLKEHWIIIVVGLALFAITQMLNAHGCYGDYGNDWSCR